jgi:aspartyl-tRNA(Asn)/glutamyl-tRNA(Gln) amidotransferase subunit A
MKPYYSSVRQLHESIVEGSLKPSEIVECFIERVTRLDTKLNSYITLDKKGARAAAQQADKNLRSLTKIPPLFGIPVAVKDIFMTKGLPTTCASKVLDGKIFPRDATVIQKLREAGAIILGKLNMHEFAFGSTSDSSYYGPVHNPWNLARVAGGSSGGSAAAVAAGLTPFSLGTDSGGSIRIPSALCGIVGLKPTYGLVSRSGVIPLAWSLDHVGPMVRYVEDAGTVLDVISDVEWRVGNVPKKFRIGIPRELDADQVDRSVRQIFEKDMSHLKAEGHTLLEVDFPYREMGTVNDVIITTEASSYHEEGLREHPELYGQPVRERLQTGLVIAATEYIRVQRLRSQYITEVRRLFRRVDVIAMPTTPMPATKIGQSLLKVEGETLAVMPAFLYFTRVFNLLGFPAISIPFGFTSNGLPVGVQFGAAPHREEWLLNLGSQLEESLQLTRITPFS